MKFSFNLNNKHSDLAKALSLVFIFSLIAFSLGFRTAHAGLFSFFSELAGGEAVAQTIDEPSILSNSQNMPLLEAATNIDPNPHKIDNYEMLAYNNALVAEIGPQGTASEIEDRVSTEISIYTVREGDNISTIAEMFGVSRNTIIWTNELNAKNPVIHEGDQLVILPISGIRYTVKKGDTIRGIVLRHKAALDEVLEYNNLTLDSTLTIGETIVIPDAELATPVTSLASKSSGSKALTAPLGYYVRPISGGKKTQGIHGHNGVDLAAPTGTIVRASAGGKVISSISNGAWNGGYGNLIIVSHDNGTHTLYAHLQKSYVKTGDIVDQSEMIGTVGNTGQSTGPHLHFEVRGAKNPF